MDKFHGLVVMGSGSRPLGRAWQCRSPARRSRLATVLIRYCFRQGNLSKPFSPEQLCEYVRSALAN
jgi:hypothetical protein